MPKFIKKPVIIEAYRFNGSSTDVALLNNWIAGGSCPEEGGIKTRDIKNFEIHTLEGVMTANPGDWIIKGVQGEFYPCKPDIFEATYDEVEIVEK